MQESGRPIRLPQPLLAHTPHADAAALGTAAIVAGGCIAYMQCHIGQGVTGIATRDDDVRILCRDHLMAATMVSMKTEAISIA